MAPRRGIEKPFFPFQICHFQASGSRGQQGGRGERQALEGNNAFWQLPTALYPFQFMTHGQTGQMGQNRREDSNERDDRRTERTAKTDGRDETDRDG